jgi:hypothetical protein
MTDLAPFIEDDFNAKAWINEVCKQVPEGESLERYAQQELGLMFTYTHFWLLGSCS